MRTKGAAALVLVASVLAGCGDGVGEDSGWRTSQDPVVVAGLRGGR